MAERIRLGVWLLGLGPVVVVVGAAVALFLGAGKKPAARTGGPTSAPTESALAADTVTSALPTPVVSAPAPGVPPPPASVPPFVAAAASSLILAGPPPEPVPELDALARPKGSDQWTTEQKLAYREQAFRALDAKERSLEQEVALARRRGDSQAVQEKQATLDYVRARRAQIDEAIRRHDPLRDAPADGGS